jgi:transcriptional regulator with XRE-family HTH domain
LSFCYVQLKGQIQKCLSANYPHVLNTLGDHLQKRRLDLGLLWKDVARLLGTGATNVALWSKGHSAPGLTFWPGIIQFLGYDPRPDPHTIGAALVRHRQGRGISQADLAGALAVDPGTLARWERQERSPMGEYLKRVELLLRDDGIGSDERRSYSGSRW